MPELIQFVWGGMTMVQTDTDCLSELARFCYFCV